MQREALLTVRQRNQQNPLCRRQLRGPEIPIRAILNPLALNDARTQLSLLGGVLLSAALRHLWNSEFYFEERVLKGVGCRTK